jgi:hypothetical protein
MEPGRTALDALAFAGIVEPLTQRLTLHPEAPMPRPHHVLALVAAATLAACTAREQEPPADSAAAPPATAAAGGDASALLASAAGRWQGESMAMEGDSVVSRWVSTSTADMNGWDITFDDSITVPVRVVEAAGDSITTEFGPFTIPGPDGQPMAVQRVRGVSRYENGTRVGTYEMRLASAPDSVIRGRFRATRMP